MRPQIAQNQNISEELSEGGRTTSLTGDPLTATALSVGMSSKTQNFGAGPTHLLMAPVLLISDLSVLAFGDVRSSVAARAGIEPGSPL